MGVIANEKIAGRVAAEVERLPPIPSNIVELRATAADPNADFSRLVPLLRQDPGLCVDLLKFANSALYGVDHRVDTIEEAVRYFGMGNLIEYVAASFSERVVRDLYSGLKGLDGFFGHSREIAAACRVLTRSARLPAHDQEAIALAGLIHDIGKLVLSIAAYQPALVLLRVQQADSMLATIQREQSMWGIDHCAIGALICRKWQFPKLFEQSILRHHAPLYEGDFSPAGAYVFLAHLVAVGEMPEELILRAMPEPVLRELQLTPAMVTAAARNLIAPASP